MLKKRFLHFCSLTNIEVQDKYGIALIVVSHSFVRMGDDGVDLSDLSAAAIR